MAAIDSKTPDDIHKLQQTLAELQQDRLLKDDALFEMEQKQLGLETENSELKIVIAKAVQREKTAGEQAAFLSSEHDKMKLQLNERTAKLSDLELRFASLETVKGRLEEQLQQQIEEADRTRRDAEKQTEKAVKFSAEISKYEDSNSTLQAENLRLKFAYEQTLKEKELMQKHEQWLDSEVTLRTEQLKELRESKSNQVLGLERELSVLQERNSVLEIQLESVREESASKTVQITEHIKASRVLEINHSQKVEQLQMELDKQTKLVALYKKTNEQEREKTTDVYKSAEQIARDLSQEKQKVEAALQETQKIEQALDECLREKEKLAAELQAEREKKKNFLLSNDDDSVRSAYDSNPPESPHPDGPAPQWSYMELFNKYQAVIEELRKCKRELRDLDGHVKQAKSEADDKSPMVESQRFQYNRILQAHKQVSARLNESKRAFEQSEEKLAAAQKEIQTLEQEREGLRNENRDLARQVLSLLKASGHGASSLVLLATERKLHAPTVPGDIISESLVEVSSVEDMQEQNRKQLAVIRQFNKQYSELVAEKEKWVAERTQIRGEAQELKKALDALKDERARQELRLDALQQSLKLGQALDDDEGSLVDDMDDDASVTSVGKRRRLGAYQKSVQHALETKNSELLRQLAEANEKDIAFRKAQRESLTEMQTTIDQLRLEGNKCRAELSQANAEVKFQKETHQAHVQSTQALEKERTREREKCAALMSSLTEHQSRLQKANSDAQTLRQQLDKATNDLANARAELELSKKGQERLLSENEKLLLEVRRQETLLGHLRDLQNALKAQDQGAVKRLTVEKEELRVECKNLKNELDSERRDKRDLLKTSTAKTEQLQTNLDTLQQQLHTAEKELASLRPRCEDAVSRLAEAQKSLDTQKEQVEILLKMKGGAKLDLTSPKLAHLGEDNKLQKTLSDTLAENARLAETLAQVEEQNSALKSFGEKTERDLRQLTQSSKDYQAKSEETVARITADNQTLARRSEELNEKLRQYEGEEGKVREDLQRRLTELSALLETANEEKRQSEAGLAQWQEQRTQLQIDLKSYSELAARAQNEREQEVIAHAADVGRLTQLKQEFDVLNRRVERAEQEAVSARAHLQTSEFSWGRQKSEFETQIQRLEAKLDDASKHAEVLLSQLDSVTLQSKRLSEQALAQSSSSSQEHPSTELNEEVDKLNKIVRYVRTERDVAVAEREQAQQELLKLQHSVQRLEGALKDERAQREQAIRADSEHRLAKETHAKVMEQLTQLNLFKESNTLLREEHSQNQNRVTELEQKLKEVEGQLVPLRATVRRLEADKEALKADCKSLEVECSRWKQRNQQLLDKYQTVDMDEYKHMQAELAIALETQKATDDSHTRETAEAKAEIEKWQKMYNSQKSTNNLLSTKVATLEAERKKQAETPIPAPAPAPVSQATNQANSKLTAMLSAARVVINSRVAELEATRKQLETVKAEAATAKAELDALKTSSTTIKAQLEQAQGERTKLQAAARAFEAERVVHAKTTQTLAALEAERSSFQKSETAAVEIQIEKERMQREMDAKMDVQKSLLQKATSDALLTDAKMTALQAELKELKKLSYNTQLESQRHEKNERTAIEGQLEAKTILADRTRELEKAQAEVRQGVAENADLKQSNLALQQQLSSLSAQLTKLQSVSPVLVKSPVPISEATSTSSVSSTLTSLSSSTTSTTSSLTATTTSSSSSINTNATSSSSSSSITPVSPLPAQATKRKGPTSALPAAKKPPATTPAPKSSQSALVSVSSSSPSTVVSAFPPSGAVKLKRTLEEMAPMSSPVVTRTVTETVSVFGTMPSFPVFASPLLSPQSKAAPPPLEGGESISILPEPVIMASAFGQSLLSVAASSSPVATAALSVLADAFSQPPLGVTPLFGLKREGPAITLETTLLLEDVTESEEKTDSTKEETAKEENTLKDNEESSSSNPPETNQEEEEQLDLSLEGEEDNTVLSRTEDETLPVIEFTANMEEEEDEQNHADDGGENHEANADVEEGVDQGAEAGSSQDGEDEESANGNHSQEEPRLEENQQDDASSLLPSSSPSENDTTDHRTGSEMEDSSSSYAETESMEEGKSESVSLEEESSTSNNEELRGHSSSSELLTSLNEESSTDNSQELRGHSSSVNEGDSSSNISGNDGHNDGSSDSNLFDEGAEEMTEASRGEEVGENSNREDMYTGDEEENAECHIEPEIVSDPVQVTS